MSYPKRHPATMQNQSEREVKLGQKKEQLKTLLVNKFRGKYQVVADMDQFDYTIREEVENFLNTQQMTEANLVTLDKKL